MTRRSKGLERLSLGEKKSKAVSKWLKEKEGKRRKYKGNEKKNNM